jgi:hypothetical protein
MARFVHARNPVYVGGEDLISLGWAAVGLTLSAYTNDKVVAPVTHRVFRTLPSGDSFVGKLIDAVTTGMSSFVVGWVVGLVNRRVGRNMFHGGMILAAGKVISAFIPGFAISAQAGFLPSSLPLPIGGPQPPSPQPNGTSSASGSSVTAQMFPNSSSVGL